MAVADYDADVFAATRARQESPAVRQSNMATLRQWGASNLVKVTARAAADGTVRGYLTFRQAVIGLTPRHMADMLGLRRAELDGGAFVYCLARLPDLNEFEVRGYTGLVDGVQLRDGLKQDSAGYRPGQGAYQIVLTKPIEALLLASLAPDEPFEPGIHPSLRHLYPPRR